MPPPSASQQRQAPPAQQQELLIEPFASVQGGMQTQEQRDAIQPGEWSWLMNFQPIGRRTLRALMGKGPTIYTLIGGDTIIYGCVVIIGSTYYAILFTEAGAAYQINLSTNAVTTIGTSGTFYSGGAPPPVYNFTSVLYPHAVAFGNSGIVIVSQLGYWAWDGTTLYSENEQAPIWLSGLTAVIVEVGVCTNGSQNITELSNTAELTVGMGVFLSGFASGTIITAIVSGGEVTVSNPFTGTTDSYSITFNWPMPTGISGNAIEIYNDEVWIVNGRQILASAPGNGANFATSAGGLSVSVTDNYVQNGYSGLKQLDGFLYLFGHGCVDVISDVQTSGSPPTTTFLRVNVSTLIGTPWRDSIAQLPSSIAFSNITGTYEVSGGQARKVSDAFDGVFENATFQGNPSACLMTLNKNVCYGLTLSMDDPDTGSAIASLALWDGRRWFLASQEVSPLIVMSEDNDSQLNGWASDGTHLFQMAAVASSTLAKKAKSWYTAAKPGLNWRKELQRAYAQFANTPAGQPLSSFTIDTEAPASFTVTPNATPGVITFVNNSGEPLQFVNSTGGDINFTTGVYPLVVGSDAPVICLLFGITVETSVETLDIVGLFIGYLKYSQWA